MNARVTLSLNELDRLRNDYKEACNKLREYQKAYSMVILKFGSDLDLDNASFKLELLKFIKANRPQ